MRLGRRIWVLVPVGMASSFLMLIFVLPVVNDTVSSYKADVVARTIADDLWNTRELATIKSRNQHVDFNLGAGEYVIPVVEDDTVQKESVKLTHWPFWRRWLMPTLMGNRA